MVTDEEKRFWKAEARKWRKIWLLCFASAMLILVATGMGDGHPSKWTVIVFMPILVVLVPIVGYANHRWMYALRKAAGKRALFTLIADWWRRRKA